MTAVIVAELLADILVLSSASYINDNYLYCLCIKVWEAHMSSTKILNRKSFLVQNSELYCSNSYLAVVRIPESHFQDPDGKGEALLISVIPAGSLPAADDRPARRISGKPSLTPAFSLRYRVEYNCQKVFLVENFYISSAF